MQSSHKQLGEPSQPQPLDLDFPELTHALQDQHFGLEKLIQKVEDNNDKLMALISLVEGDATFVQTQYMIKHRDWKLGEIFGIAFQQQEKFFSAPLLAA